MWVGISNQILAAYLDAPYLSWSPMHDLLTLGSLLHCCSLPEITVCRYIWLHVPKTFSNHFSSCSSLDVSRCILNARSTVWEKRFPPRVEIKQRNHLSKNKPQCSPYASSTSQKRENVVPFVLMSRLSCVPQITAFRHIPYHWNYTQFFRMVTWNYFKYLNIVSLPPIHLTCVFQRWIFHV